MTATKEQNVCLLLKSRCNVVKAVMCRPVIIPVDNSECPVDLQSFRQHPCTEVAHPVTTAQCTMKTDIHHMTQNIHWHEILQVCHFIGVSVIVRYHCPNRMSHSYQIQHDNPHRYTDHFYFYDNFSNFLPHLVFTFCLSILTAIFHSGFYWS